MRADDSRRHPEGAGPALGPGDGGNVVHDPLGAARAARPGPVLPARRALDHPRGDDGDFVPHQAPEPRRGDAPGPAPRAQGALLGGDDGAQPPALRRIRAPASPHRGPGIRRDAAGDVLRRRARGRPEGARGARRADGRGGGTPARRRRGSPPRGGLGIGALARARVRLELARAGVPLAPARARDAPREDARGRLGLRGLRAARSGRAGRGQEGRGILFVGPPAGAPRARGGRAGPRTGAPAGQGRRGADERAPEPLDRGAQAVAGALGAGALGLGVQEAGDVRLGAAGP
ncbi:MAG: hypothetical protein FD126_2283 [Elusimicrobia bacterium]|nr:MAG: hypothetical protein FD126_2283 [Elusimicrobiota bacterium]